MLFGKVKNCILKKRIKVYPSFCHSGTESKRESFHTML